jgi:hypothetical protein
MLLEIGSRYTCTSALLTSTVAAPAAGVANANSPFVIETGTDVMASPVRSASPFSVGVAPNTPRGAANEPTTHCAEPADLPVLSAEPLPPWV